MSASDTIKKVFALIVAGLTVLEKLTVIGASSGTLVNPLSTINVALGEIALPAVVKLVMLPSNEVPSANWIAFVRQSVYVIPSSSASEKRSKYCASLKWMSSLGTIWAGSHCCGSNVLLWAMEGDVKFARATKKLAAVIVESSMLLPKFTKMGVLTETSVAPSCIEIVTPVVVSSKG